MRILITEARHGDAAGDAAVLAAAGHEIATCHDSETDAAQLPCRALTARGCPLDGPDIDLVVDARRTAGPFTSREWGAMCAAASGRPLLVCGLVPAAQPPWVDPEAACSLDGLLAACRAAVALPSKAARRAVRCAVQTVLRHAGERPPLDVSLRARDGAVDVTIALTELPTRAVQSRLRAICQATLARYTPMWHHTCVDITTRTGRQGSP